MCNLAVQRKYSILFETCCRVKRTEDSLLAERKPKEFYLQLFTIIYKLTVSEKAERILFTVVYNYIKLFTNFCKVAVQLSTFERSFSQLYKSEIKKKTNISGKGIANK